MLPHADYQDSPPPPHRRCLSGDVKRENGKCTTGFARKKNEENGWCVNQFAKKAFPERSAVQGEEATLPVAETNLGSVGVRARQGPGRDSARSGLTAHARVRMRRSRSPLAHRSRGTAECERTMKRSREHRKTLTHT